MYKPRTPRAFGFLLRDATELYVQRFEHRAAELGLTLSQCKALLYLISSEGVCQVELASMTELDPMTLVRILDRMEMDGWVERRSDPTDRRARRLYLKPQSKPLLVAIERTTKATGDEAFAGLSLEDVNQVITTLEQVRRNLTLLRSLPSQN